MNKAVFQKIGSNYKKIFENFLSLNILQLTNYIFPLITMPYVTRIVGAEKFGLIYYSYSVITYLNMIADFGFFTSGVIEVAKNRESNDKLSKIFNSIMIIKVFLVIISFLLLVIFVFSCQRFRNDWYIYFISFGMLIGNTFFPNWFFQGIEHMKMITLLNFIARFVSTICIFIFLRNEAHFYIVPILNATGPIISTIIAIFIVYKKFNLRILMPTFEDIKHQLKYSFSFFIAQFSISFASNSNTFFLGLINTNTLVAYYIAAEKIYMALFNLSAPINLTMTPYMVKNKNLKLYKIVFILVMILTLGIYLFLTFGAKQIITIFYGVELINAYTMLKFFAILIVVIFFSMYIGLPLLGAYGYTKEVNFSTIAGSVAHIIGLSILFILQKFNPYSIICMSIASTSLILLIRIYYINKYKILKRRIVHE